MFSHDMITGYTIMNCLITFRFYDMFYCTSLLLNERKFQEYCILLIFAVVRKHGKFLSFLRMFFNTRPPRNQLKQSGIVKERVFGCDLGEHLLNSGHDGMSKEKRLKLLFTVESLSFKEVNGRRKAKFY